jgi:hypothetical protein
MGLWIDHEIQGLTVLSDTVVHSGQAMHDTAAGLGSLAGLPFVGDRIAELERRVELEADRAIESGRSSRSNISRLAVLIGITVAVIPTVPPIALYLLIRFRPRKGVGGHGARDGVSR